MQKSLFNISENPRDVVYTPSFVSKQIIEFINPKGSILDPCKGDGSFYNLLDNADYCEIQEGKDFFECKKRYDWIIGNPPYSLFEEFLRHSMHLSDNVSFLVPVNKVFQRQVIMNIINNYGGIKSMIVYGSGTLIKFPFGFSVANFHLQKDYKGGTEILMGMKQIF